MNNCRLSQSEEKFAELVWQNEPIGSGKLVKLCKNELMWEKSTTYTVLKKLCEKGVLQNQNAIITSLIKKNDFYTGQSRRFVEDTFDGSLPRFLTAFIGGKKLSTSQAAELKRLIDEHKGV